MNAPAHMNLPAAARSLRWRAWLLAAPAALALVAALLVLSLRQDLWAARDKLHFLTTSALGIAIGMPVKLNGFEVGTVEQIVLLPPSQETALRVRVELGINRHYMGYIPKTTVARLLQEGLIGQSVIELLPSRYDARPVINGEVLPFERNKGLGEIAEQLQGKLTPVLQHVEALGAGLNDPQGDFQQSLKNGRRLLEALPATNAQAQRSLAAIEASASRLEAKLARSLAGVERSTALVEARLPALLEKTEQTLENARAASGDVRQITGQATGALPQLLEQAQGATRDGRQLVQGAAQSWPLRLLLAPPAPQAIAADSQQGLPAPTVEPK